MTVDLLDANVWLSLSVEDHKHHERAERYWHREAPPEVAFCRITALALLRHLTMAAIMGPRILTGTAAWGELSRWLSCPTVRLQTEPAGIEALLQHWSNLLDLRSNSWTDAYLAAFAVAGGMRLVSFDNGYRRFSGLDFLHLAT